MQTFALWTAKTEAQYQRHALPGLKTYCTKLLSRLTYSYILGNLKQRNDSRNIRYSSRYNRPWRPRRGIEVQLYSSHSFGARRGWMINVTLLPLYSQKYARYPFCYRPGGPQGRSVRVRKISSPLRFDPRTVQTVASRYTLSRPFEIFQQKFKFCKFFPAFFYLAL